MVLVTLPVWGVLVLFCRMSLNWNVFLIIRLELWVWGRGPQGESATFITSHQRYMLSIWLVTLAEVTLCHVDLGHLAEVSVRLLEFFWWEVCPFSIVHVVFSHLFQYTLMDIYLFFTTAYITQLTYLKCKIKWFMVHLPNCATIKKNRTITVINFRTFRHPQKKPHGL